MWLVSRVKGTLSLSRCVVCVRACVRVCVRAYVTYVMCIGEGVQYMGLLISVQVPEPDKWPEEIGSVGTFSGATIVPSL